MSVGGVRDEAEIRGHRRTYIGAMPGTIIRSLRDAESRNPVILIDEIDKMGSDWRGDPSSAMLEVLDPEQNKHVPRPLPRPAVRPLEGALHLHREHARHDPGAAARPHGHDRAVGLHGGREARDREALPAAEAARGRTACKRSQLTLSDTVLRTIIREYTREAGVRNLERRLADVCRKAATQVAKGKTQKIARRRQAAARVARAAAVLRRGAQAHLASRASRPGSPTRRPAATCSSSRRPRIPGKGKPARSPASSAT